MPPIFRLRFALPLALLLVALLSVIASAACAQPSFVAGDMRPNLVIVLCDDLGYGDLACYGDERLKTPHIDRFARQGIRLTNCYAAAANCSPARTGLMTGRTPYRVGVHNWIPMFSPMHVRRSEITIATLLRNSGYTTCHVGKWHLNGMFNLTEQPQPWDHGFDWWYSTQNNCLPNHKEPDNFVRNGVPAGKQEGYASQVVVREAIDWLSTKRDKSKPFFMYVCFHEPHEPIATEPRFMEMYPSDDPSYSRHHGNITQMDESFGRLMKALDDQDLSENTAVFFTSDNGPAITRYHPHGSTGPLRDKKGAVYEGGIRVPGILRWPVFAEAGTVCDEPVSGVDVLPTLCAIAGISPPADRAIDGASMLPILKGEPIERKTPLYWQFNFSHAAPRVAMRVGDWKILATLTGPQQRPGGGIEAAAQQALKTAELDRFELYNLKDDVAETTDLAEKEPERLAQMAEQLRKLYREVRHESPTWPEWEFARYEAQRIIWPELPQTKPPK
jgi:arylsulfatase A